MDIQAAGRPATKRPIIIGERLTIPEPRVMTPVSMNSSPTSLLSSHHNPSLGTPGENSRFLGDPSIRAGVPLSYQTQPSHRGVKRERDMDANDSAQRPRRSIPHSNSDSVDAEASEFIQLELRQGGDLLRNRRAILESALEFINQVSCWSNASVGEDMATLESGPLPYFPAETLFMLLRERNTDSACPINVQFPNHLLPKTVERMGTALVNETVSGQTKVQYQVCMYYKMYIMFGMWPRLEAGNPLKKHIQASKNRYRDLLLQAMGKLSVLAHPTISLCQALIAGGMFTHFTGESSRSWSLLALASRVLVALGHHKPENTANPPKTEAEYEIHACVFWCFTLDRMLSMHLGRPPSLPSLEVNRAWFSHPELSRPLVVMGNVLGDFGCIQEMVLKWRETHSKSNDRDGTGAKKAVAAIQQRMAPIYSQLSKVRQSLPNGEKSHSYYMWRSIEFAYYSLDTVVLRLSPDVASDPSTRQKCLTSARLALLALSEVQDWEICSQNQVTDEDYPLFLACTIHAYPLCPFFVLFCNVVGTSSVEDFLLMQRVTSGLSGKAVARLHDLFSKLIDLCRPLFTSPDTATPSQLVATIQQPQFLQPVETVAATGSRMSFSVNNIPLGQVEPNSQQYPLSPYGGTVNCALSTPRTATPLFGFNVEPQSLWAEDTMIGLFNYEPSLSWLNGTPAMRGGHCQQI